MNGEEKADDIPIHAVRTDHVPGTHTLTWKGPNDQIVLSHEAFNRVGFASGAVDAAEWLIGKKGVFSMDDLLS
jgi:4-hydroxy-tetrahydrodipicolinate reductase